MSVRSGQSVTCVFTTRNFSTGVQVNADSLPTGTLYVNGTADAATVTVTNITTGRYKAQVTLPTLAVGDVCSLDIAATVNSISDNAVVWSDTKDIVIDSAGLADATAVKIGPSGSAQTITCGAGVTVLASVGTASTSTAQTGDNFARLGAPAGASISADIAAVKSETDTILTDVNTGGGAIYTRLGPPVGASLSADIASVKSSVGSVTGAVGSVTGAVGSVTGSVGSVATGGIAAASFAAAAITATVAPNLDAAVSSRMATYAQPTGFLAATFPTTVASTTNITAGTITTTTNLTNLPAVTTDWLSAAAVSAGAVTKIQAGLSTYAGGDTSGTTTLLTRVTAAVALASTALTNVTWTDTKAAFLDGSVLSRLATSAYTAPLSSSQTAAAVLDATTAAHATAGTIGKAIGDSGSASDPLQNQTSGYATGTAGNALNRVGSGQITTESIVSQNGDFEVVIGCDYLSRIGTAISWTNALGSWPNLTGATITVSLHKGATTVSYTGAVTAPVGPPQYIYLELTAAQTILLSGNYTFNVVATLATSGNVGLKVPLVSGKVTTVVV